MRPGLGLGSARMTFEVVVWVSTATLFLVGPGREVHGPPGGPIAMEAPVTGC